MPQQKGWWRDTAEPSRRPRLHLSLPPVRGANAPELPHSTRDRAAPGTRVGSTSALGALVDQVTHRNMGLANSDGNLAFHTCLAPWGEHSPWTQAWGRTLLPDPRPPLRASARGEDADSGPRSTAPS